MRIKFLLLALGLGLSPAAPAQAEPRLNIVQPNWVMPVQGRERDERRAIRPLREVVEELRARHGGDLISARLEEGSRPVYVLRWRMPDGEVRDFRVNAAR